MRSVIWGSPSVTSNTTMDPTNLKVTSGFLSFKKVRCESKSIYTCLIPWSSNCNKKTRSRGAVFRKRSKNDASYWSHLRLTTAKGCPCYKYHKGAPFEPLFFFRGGTSRIFEVRNVIRDGHASLDGFMWTPRIQENGACCCSSAWYVCFQKWTIPDAIKKVTHHATLCLHDHLP